ncbi:MAG: WhiB family transcriptional regulator [Acidimicrobiales bacterium]|nr:WhiB family transcriptional regulator [Acidimicrobiales bacterium]
MTWFPEQGVRPDEAKTTCETCPVLLRCRLHALRQGLELEGVWGGLSKADRAKVRRERRAT